MAAAFKRFKNHVRRRLLIGLVIFAPFALTIWILLKLVEFGKNLLIGPFVHLIEESVHKWPRTIGYMAVDQETGELVGWIEYPVLGFSIALTLFLLYLMGLISATFLGKRVITDGERLLLRIPGVEFVYKTVKQVVEIMSRPRSQAFQKVVLIEYPRRGIRGLAFFSGLTVLQETGEVLVNVFIPTTPNPTSGFLLLMEPKEVLETNLTVSEATRFIISGGVVAMENLRVFPFDVEKNGIDAPDPKPQAQRLPETEARRLPETEAGELS